jgi:hypothetical protein
MNQIGAFIVLWFYVAAFIVKLLLDSNFEKAYLLE